MPPASEANWSGKKIGPQKCGNFKNFIQPIKWILGPTICWRGKSAFFWSAALLVEAVNLRCALWVHSKTVQRENTKSAHACGACNLRIADRAISSSSLSTIIKSSSENLYNLVFWRKTIFQRQDAVQAFSRGRSSPEMKVSNTHRSEIFERLRSTNIHQWHVAKMVICVTVPRLSYEPGSIDQVPSCAPNRFSFFQFLAVLRNWSKNAADS